ncbi:MAG: AbrB/MazE/SpoVT family DNA-binding domain-containing protein [Syntrophomonas sp.]|nr:AbrB/MazE/SpoVT family DNA-binding domain-containing protein [Syntrophomonas sp.]
MLLQLRQRSQITLPNEVLKQLNLKAGDNFEVRVENDEIVLKPVLVIDRKQAWFWGNSWQVGEKEADEDFKAGRFETAESVDELMKKLGE